LDTDIVQTSKSDGSRLQSIIEASKIVEDQIYADLQKNILENPNYTANYHKKCISLYLTTAKRNKRKDTSLTRDHISSHPKNKACSAMGPPFDWLNQCF
jgi:hypothetical protein